MVEDKNILSKILMNHYEWCKKNGRDISWYKRAKKEMRKVLKKSRNNS